MQAENTGFIFPGQGSQKTGMLSELADAFSEVKDIFAEASEVLGYDLWQLIQTGPEVELSKTHITQPAILTTSVAIWTVWLARGGAEPVMMAGHSLGEYSALTCANAIDFTDAVILVKKRGEYMQTAVPLGVGAMAAIVGLEDAKVIRACEQAKQGEEVAAVNFNSPGQVVIAGHIDAVNRAGELCKEAGAKRALPLPVSAPFHSVLMQPVADQFAQDLANISIKTPRIPVIQNFGLESAVDPDTIKANLVAQIFNPVPWVETINKFSEAGINTVFEIGPGKVLSGLNKRIKSDMSAASINSPDSLEAGLELLANL